MNDLTNNLTGVNKSITTNSVTESPCSKNNENNGKNGANNNNENESSDEGEIGDFMNFFD
jgi:hypothetical protein